MLRGDLTYFKDGWRGNHEFQTGFFAAPRSTYDQITEYVNDGFVLEEARLRDRQQPGGRVRAVPSPLPRAGALQTRAAEDRNVGFYVQDNWRPTNRLVINGGVRFDWVKRNDDVFNIERQNCWQIGPRIGLSYMVTDDAKNILRASYVRRARADDGPRCHHDLRCRRRGRLSATISTIDGDGRFETSPDESDRADARPSPRSSSIPTSISRSSTSSSSGSASSSRGQWSADVACMNRSYQDMYARVDVNGRYPSGPGQPFLRLRPRRSQPRHRLPADQQLWSTLEWQALEMTVAKNLSNNFQALIEHQPAVAALRRHVEPDRPGAVHPAGRVPERQAPLHAARQQRGEQPAAHDRHDACTPTGRRGRSTRCGSAAPTSRRTASSTAVSYTILAGPWSGRDRRPAAGGRSAAGAVRPRDVPAGQRHDGAQSARDPHALRRIRPRRRPGAGAGDQDARPEDREDGRLGGTREVELAGNIFNLLNDGNYTQYNYSGANERFNPNFLQLRNQQAARGSRRPPSSASDDGGLADLPVTR